MALGPLGLIDLAHPPLTLAEPIIEAAEQYLLVPSGLGAGHPMKLSPEQVELLWAWYSVTPDGRRFIYNRKLIVRMSKGWAKSPIGAVDMFAGLCLDVIPDGLNANGRPVGRPHPAPWLQVAANSLDQTDNLYRQLFDMLRESPAVDDFRLDVGLTRIQFRDKAGWIEPVTAAAGSREGQPISGATLEETHLMLPSNGGVALERTIRRNALKMQARTVELTNAYVPGAGSVAQRSEEQVARGRGAGVLLVKREAEAPEDPGVQLRDPSWVLPRMEKVYGFSSVKRGGWVDCERLTQDIVEANDDELPMMLRFFFNLVVAPEETALDLVKWARLASAHARLTQGDTIALGFDGSDVGDATALYACRWPDWLVVKLRVWERPLDDDGRPIKGAWSVPRAEVKQAITDACTTYKVVRGYFDDSGWQSEIDELTAVHGQSVMRFPHRQDVRIGPACERWSTMIAEGTLLHDGDDVLPRHASNARRVHIGKPESRWWRPARKIDSLPIDALSAAISAVHALGDAVAHGEVTADVTPYTAASSTPPAKGAKPAGDRDLFRPSRRLNL
jgi:hypothetical protein